MNLFFQFIDSPLFKRAILALVFLYFFFILVYFVLRPGHEGDTQVLVNNTIQSLKCFKESRIHHCPEAGQFPPYQLFPSLLLAALGLSAPHIVDTLCYINVLCALGILWIFRKTFRPISTDLYHYALLTLFSTYWIAYTHVSLGEMLAAFLILALTRSLLRGGSTLLTSSLLFFCTLTKEVAFPFLSFMTLVIYITQPSFKHEQKPIAIKPLLTFGTSIFLGIGIQVLLNLSRFGNVLNPVYLNTQNIVTDPFIQVAYFFALWFSPAGGLLWYSPLFMIPFFYQARVLKKHSFSLLIRLRLLSPALILLGLCLGFSKYIAPMGWYAWGNRYLVPWLPALFFWILHDTGSYFISALKHFVKSKPKTSGMLALICALAAMPHFRAIVYHSYINHVIESTPAKDPQSIRSVLLTPFWSFPHRIFEAFYPGSNWGAFIFATLGALFLLYFARLFFFKFSSDNL